VFGKKIAHYQMKKIVMVGESMAKSNASRGPPRRRGCRIYRELDDETHKLSTLCQL